MDDYTHVPVHNSPDIRADFLKQISVWQDKTEEYSMDVVGKFDKHIAAVHIVPEAYSHHDALESGFIPARSPDAAGVFTRSKQISQRNMHEKEP